MRRSSTARVLRVAARIDSSSIAASLVSKTFTVPELRHVHATLTGKPQRSTIRDA
ncbi:MAG TPA: hypothetical protein VM925_17475 [Labilithrix sp.]|nr:hypothetical protein [Labilithrix sp.]